MPKYSDREKRGYFNQLRGSASHCDADLKLLEKLDPKNELLFSKTSKDKLADKVLFALLDHATRCDIVDFRREYSRLQGLAKEQNANPEKSDPVTEKLSALDEKEQELSDKESELEDKEQELLEKEEELNDKEAKIKEKQKESKKKAVAKKKNIRK